MNNQVFEKLMTLTGRSNELDGQVKVTGNDPVLPTRFPIGEAVAGVHAAIGLAVSDLWELQTGRKQEVKVDVRAAAATLQSYVYLRVKGSRDRTIPPNVTRFYPAKDGRWVLIHAGFPHLRQGMFNLLECEDTPESVAEAVLIWEAEALEEAIAEAGLCGAMARSAPEWAEHPQGQVLSKMPVLEIIKIADSPPEPLPPADRPLSGLRVLDLTRVLAGPTCARTLAEHGADVLKIGAEHLPSAEFFVQDTGHGKRSAFLDLSEESGSKKLNELIRGADVFSQSYRLGALDNRGYSPEKVAEMRPGIVYVSMNCYGHEGPWKNRKGWEQLAQTVTGLAVEQGSLTAADKGGDDDEGNKNGSLLSHLRFMGAGTACPPRLLPAAVTDYTTGYLAAFGALTALALRAREGGSYYVRASLTQTAMMIEGLGRIGKEEASAQDRMLPEEESEKLVTVTETPWGAMTHLAPILSLSETPARWTRPTVPLGTHEPVWLDSSR
jgi:crotonobetainyl-CoA:carnitine CoA-transferase CaiB-like acyl-CoA transferase